MEFSEYLQLDRMAHWPRFLRYPVVYEKKTTTVTEPLIVFEKVQLISLLLSRSGDSAIQMGDSAHDKIKEGENKHK